MLRHWRKLAGNRAAMEAQMMEELERVVGERAIFHGISKTPLRKGKIDSVKAADCLVIVDEETREVCIVPIEYITQIRDHKLPRFKPLAVVDDRPEIPPEVKVQLEMDSEVYGNGFAEFSNGKWSRIDPRRVEIDGHEIVVGEASPEATAAREKELDAVRPLSEPVARITFVDKLGDPPQGKDSPGLLIMDEVNDPAVIQEARRRLMKELEVLPDEIKEAYANAEIDPSLFGTLTLRGERPEPKDVFYREDTTEGWSVGDLFVDFLMQFQATMMNEQALLPDTIVVATDVLALVETITGYKELPTGKRPGYRLVGFLELNRISVYVDPQMQAGLGCMKVSGQMHPKHHEWFEVKDKREEDP